MAPAMATNRLRKELVKLQKEPPPGVIAEPDESNILKWHYAVRGPSDTTFDGGVYIGKLVFPSEYPMKPPGILMLTPSGRFKVNTRLCLSMSDFHPESWNPMWSVATIIQGVQSFMASDEQTTGGIKTSASEQRRLAAASMDYNRAMFPNLFGGDMDAAFHEADQARAASEAKLACSTDTPASRNRRSKRDKQPHLPSEDDGKDESTEKKEDPKKEQLTLDEMEKRRIRNAKKRAKQKQKKSCSQDANGEGAGSGGAEGNDDDEE